VVSLVVPNRPFVASDLDDVEWDGRRWEVIDGMLVVSPAPFAPHQWSIGQLHLLLYEACPPGMLVMLSPFDWKPPEGDMLEPDLLVMRDEDYQNGPLRNTPLLVIEVLSRSNPSLDTAVKRARYEALGVPAYWIVDPIPPGSVLCLRLVEGRYDEVARCSGDESYTADYPFPVRLTPSKLVRSFSR
ncbi:MAG: Uma2 family endonuclease, partial [Acidimicrobiales bacterium]